VPVVLQFAGLLYLALSGPVLSSRPALRAFELAALVPGAWAALVMRPWKVNVTPAVRPGAVLLTRGPYRWIRHPMYASLFGLTGAWLLDAFSPVRALVWAAFVANMVVKMSVEERYLSRRFDHYDAYRRRTRRVIPFVY